MTVKYRAKNVEHGSRDSSHGNINDINSSKCCMKADFSMFPTVAKLKGYLA